MLSHTILILAGLQCLSAQTITNVSIMGVVRDLYFKVMELQVPETEHFLPPFHFDEEMGMWPSDVRMNFHGDPDHQIMRDMVAVFDNNMFATTYILSCLFEAKKYIHELWYGPEHMELAKGISAIWSHHDMNVDYDNSLMTFWPQRYNETLKAYNSYPINLNDMIKVTNMMPWNATFEFMEKLGLKNVEEMMKMLLGIRGGYIGAFHIPPDFDDTFLNVGLGSILREMAYIFPTYEKMWSSHNYNLTESVFDAVKKYAYRPFSGDQRVNTIDSRTYYYLRRWLQHEKEAGNDVALVSTWIQDTDEVRTWYGKGVMMPYNINNIDVTVCANFMFGVTNGIIHGLFQPSLLDDPEILQIYNDTSRMIAFQMKTNFSDRADLALTYYPSVIEFYWFVARTYNVLEATMTKEGKLPRPIMETVLVDLRYALRTYATPRILTAGAQDTLEGRPAVYYDDFLGVDDTDYNNKSENNAEDRVFTTSMALSALLTTWAMDDGESGRYQWLQDTPESVKTTAERIATWLYYKALSEDYRPWNALFSGSFKGVTTIPVLYPMNRIELFNGTRVNTTDHLHGPHIEGMEGYIPENEYQEMIKHIHKYDKHTPTVFPGYNQNAPFFPFWCSEAYTYVVSMLGLAKYARLM